MTTFPPAFLDAPDFQEAKRKKGAVQAKAEWSFQANLHKFLERVVHEPCEIRGFDKAGAQRWVGAWSKAVARGIKDGTGDHLVAQGAPRRLLWIECKGKTDATPAQIGTADAYERCGIPTVRECRTMAQALVGLRDAGFRLHGNADNLAIEYQARADASLRELALRKKDAPKKKRAVGQATPLHRLAPLAAVAGGVGEGEAGNHMSITAQTIRTALGAHYNEGGWTLAWEVADSSGFNGKRWADCVAFNLWPSRGHAVHGVEIKISRSDWQRELAKPEKAEAIHQYCNQWWVAAKKDVVVTCELPDGWGLLEYQESGRHAGKLVITKPASSIQRGDLPRDFLAAFLKAVHRKDDAELNALIKEAAERRVAAERAHWENTHRLEREKAVGKLAKIEAALAKVGVGSWGYDNDELALAVAFVVKGHLLGRYSQAQNTIEALSKAERDVALVRESLTGMLGALLPSPASDAA